jgi:hypothetical protein
MGRLESINVSPGGVPKRPVAEATVGDFSRLSQDDHPGWSRICARVLHGGPIRVGDVVDLAGEGVD